MTGWENLRRKLRKTEKEKKNLERSLKVIRTVSFMKGVTLNDVQAALIEEERLRELRAEPLF